MIVGLRNFHKRKDVVPDSNFWCGCPVQYVLFRQKNGKYLPISIRSDVVLAIFVPWIGNALYMKLIALLLMSLLFSMPI